MGALPATGVELGEQPPWAAWQPREAAELLNAVDVPWAVAGGWALDLNLGVQSRPHNDLEIAVPAASFDAIRIALVGYEFHVVGRGRAWPLTSPQFRELHQTWVWDPVAATYRMDVFREPHDGELWICRRCTAIRMPYEALIRRTPDGIPFVSPEVVLLFKAKADRPKDRTDLAATLPHLDAVQRRWLRDALEAVHPDHAWLNLVE